MKELFYMADKIKQLEREQMGYTQAELARKLKLTRSSMKWSGNGFVGAVDSYGCRACENIQCIYRLSFGIG